MITDMTHFPDPDCVPDPPAAVARLRDYLGAIVAFATSRTNPSDDRSPVRCRRRPKHRPCRGWIRAQLDEETPVVHWCCPVCGESGRISGWEGTSWDHRDLASPRDGALIVFGPFARSGAEPPPAPDFTAAAQRRWDSIEAQHRVAILNSVFCGICLAGRSMQLLEGHMKRGDLILHGRCTKCGNDVARVVEGG
jgi:hypothetical protein